MDYATRFAKLNDQQQEAVTTIDGPVLVVAGPGTGKTELLSMRAAHILRETDTLPSSILCLTFTESGARAMQERLATIIGPDAFKVAIHTFHSFGTDIMNQYSEFFYQGSDFRPADDLDQHTILSTILSDLPHDNPLRVTMNGEFTYQKDIARSISEFKKAGLTSDELRAVLDDNTRYLDQIEPIFSQLFRERINKSVVAPFTAAVEQLPAYDAGPLPPGIMPLAEVFIAEATRAGIEAEETDSQKAITAFKNAWFERNNKGEQVFKARKRQELLMAIGDIYDRYLLDMQTAKLYDFDDMILRVTQAMEIFPELRFNLQERYQYIMVDEFQDTNMAQMRILHALTGHASQEGRANIMAVGDDDQAIYSFQGADVGNILTFSDQYSDPAIITLRDNYRSVDQVLTASRSVITQGSERLEMLLDHISKQLSAHYEPSSSEVSLREYDTIEHEYASVARRIAEQIESGTAPGSIAVIARKHDELIALLPYLAHYDVPVSYERRESILQSDVVMLLERLTQLLLDIRSGQLAQAQINLPEVLTHPAFNLSPEIIWKISLSAYEKRQNWLEVMLTIPETTPIAQWLIALAQHSFHAPLERMIDVMLGMGDETIADFTSPLGAYFLHIDDVTSVHDRQLDNLEVLRTLRDHVRETARDELQPKLEQLSDFIASHRAINSHIIARHARAQGDDEPLVHLMTAHKSKGLEFEHVYIIDAVDTVWGEKARGGSRKINYPANLPIAPQNGTIDERLRLFFVAMTRAKSHLHMSYALEGEGGKALQRASFLTDMPYETSPAPATAQRLEAATIAWYDRLIKPIEPPQTALLAPILENYHLSATHLNNFLDVSRGGPQSFFLQNLLRVPSTMSPEASYGSAVHAALAGAHSYFVAHDGRTQPLAAILEAYDQALANARQLTDQERELYTEKGHAMLTAFLAAHPDQFSSTQKVELSFRHQAVRLDDARLTGAMDVVDVNQADKLLDITDYKTGKPNLTWTGKSGYEKIKLHKYRQQLMFYQLLAKHSRDWSDYTVDHNQLVFVEPDRDGEFHTLEATITDDDLARFSRLIDAVWQRIMQLDFPDTSAYEPTIKGVEAFEQDLIDRNI